jgi:hypothetical protein
MADDGDEEWKSHPLREYLRLELVAGIIPFDTRGREGMTPQAVWDKYCDVRPDLFEGMKYPLFVGRLRSLRQQTKRDFNRRDQDQEAFDIHQKNFPRRPFDSLGRPNWFGSGAKELLEADIEAGLYPQMKPADLRMTRPEYMMFELDAFRHHIHQTIKTEKYIHTRKVRDAEEKASRAIAREKKKKAAAKKAEKDAKKAEKEKAKAEKEKVKAEKAKVKAEKEKAKAARQAAGNAGTQFGVF